MPRFKTDGTYRSGFEKTIAQQLQHYGISFEYETEQLEYFKKQSSTHCNTCGSSDVWKRHWYSPDFIIKGKTKFYVEVKGRFTSRDRTKMRAVKHAHPDLDIRLLFQENQIIKGKKAERYSDWAERNGFKYAVGKYPEEWR